MKRVFAEIFPSGLITSHVEAVTVVNNTQKLIDWSVPTDTLRVLEGYTMTNPDSVARDLYARLYSSAAKTERLMYLSIGGSTPAGSHTCFPNNDDLAAGYSNNKQSVPLGPGMTVEFTWAAGGVSAGGTDTDGLAILYRELPLT